MRSLVIDTNLLCLLVVGLWQPEAIARYKRLKPYDLCDFEAIRSIIARFDSLAICPHVLAETSNLLGYTDDPTKQASRRMLAELIRRSGELQLSSAEATERVEYERLGLTDAVLLVLASGKRTLLSADSDLCVVSHSSGYPTINYNYVREGALRIDQI